MHAGRVGGNGDVCLFWASWMACRIFHLPSILPSWMGRLERTGQDGSRLWKSLKLLCWWKPQREGAWLTESCPGQLCDGGHLLCTSCQRRSFDCVKPLRFRAVRAVCPRWLLQWSCRRLSRLSSAVVSPTSSVFWGLPEQLGLPQGFTAYSIAWVEMNILPLALLSYTQ